MRLRDWAKRGALALLRGYKWAISPMLPPSCRYVPTCSEYVAEAIELHGVVKGSALGAWRLLRCHPLARGGVDLVPHTDVSVRPHTSTCTHTH